MRALPFRLGSLYLLSISLSLTWNFINCIKLNDDIFVLLSFTGVEVYPPGRVTMMKQLPSLLMDETGEGAADSRLQQALCVLLQLCRAAELSVQEGSTSVNCEEIVFYRENSQDAYRLFWLPGNVVKETISAGSRLLKELLTPQLVADVNAILEQPDGLEKTASFLEMSLFGPAGNLTDGEPLDVFQRWLDVERASVLNELIRTQGLWRVKLSVMEEFRLAFLVSSSPHHLLETSQI